MQRILTWLGLLLLALVAAAVGGAFYMGGKSYELVNQVVMRPPYPASTATDGFHRTLFIADMHADTFTFVDSFMEEKDYAHLDYRRARAGGFDLMTMAVATEVPLDSVKPSPDGVRRGLNLISVGSVLGMEPAGNWFSRYARGNWVVDNVRRTVAENPDELALIMYQEDLSELLTEHATGASGRMGLLLAVEGAHVLDTDPERMDELYARGVRMLSLTHAFDNAYGGSSEGVERYGITADGEALLDKLQSLGIIIDLAHGSPALVNDLLERVRTPVVYSHGGIQGQCDIDRNLADAALEKIKRNGGLVAIGFWDRVLCGDTPADIAASMRYVADRIGAEHLALGSDFDGGVRTVFDASGLPLLTAELFTAGFSEAEVRMIMGENYARLLLATLPPRRSAIVH